MLKVKHERECDCVVAGFRWHKRGEKTAVGSLLLGLYDDDGQAAARRRRRQLHRREAHASWSSSSRPTARTRSTATPGESGPRRRSRTPPATAMPGAKSRWSQGKDLSWEPLRPELVVEVAYEHMQGDALPPHRAVPPLAPRQAAARLHLRAARSRRPPRAARHLRDRALGAAASIWRTSDVPIHRSMLTARSISRGKTRIALVRVHIPPPNDSPRPLVHETSHGSGRIAEASRVRRPSV